MAEQLQQTRTINIDKLEITGFQFVRDRGGNGALAVSYSLGYEDGEGNVVPVESHQFGIHGSKFDEVVGAMPNPDLNMYDNIKAALYPLAMEADAARQEAQS